jgi:hypothetical protein
VHREELVVLLGRDQRVLGPRQLQAHHERVEAAQQEEAKSGGQIALAYRVILDGREDADKARWVSPGALELIRRFVGLVGCRR